MKSIFNFLKSFKEVFTTENELKLFIQNKDISLYRVWLWEGMNVNDPLKPRPISLKEAEEGWSLGNRDIFIIKNKYVILNNDTRDGKLINLADLGTVILNTKTYWQRDLGFDKHHYAWLYFLEKGKETPLNNGSFHNMYGSKITMEYLINKKQSKIITKKDNAIKKDSHPTDTFLEGSPSNRFLSFEHANRVAINLFRIITQNLNHTVEYASLHDGKITQNNEISSIYTTNKTYDLKKI